MKKLTVVWRPGEAEDFRVEHIQVATEFPLNEVEKALHRAWLDEEVSVDATFDEEFPDGFPIWDLCAIFPGHIYPDW